MYGKGKRALLQECPEQGWSKAAVAAKLGISRRTVYHWMEAGQLDRDADDEAARRKARPAVGRKIDPFRPIIETRLRAYPLLSDVRLHEETRTAGGGEGHADCGVAAAVVRQRVSGRCSGPTKGRSAKPADAPSQTEHGRGREWILRIVPSVGRPHRHPAPAARNPLLLGHLHPALPVPGRRRGRDRRGDRALRGEAGAGVQVRGSVRGVRVRGAAGREGHPAPLPVLRVADDRSGRRSAEPRAIRPATAGLLPRGPGRIPTTDW